MIKKATMVIVVIILLSSCDLLRNSPFYILTWSPGSGYHQDISSIELSLLFSGDCDRIKVEQAFSLLEDGRTINGKFLWQGNRLTFIPANRFLVNRDYTVAIGTTAQDKNGLSLDYKFEEKFTTRQKSDRLNITSINPENGGFITGSRDTIDVCFSNEISISSCIGNISINPSINGTWISEDEGKMIRFTPLELWKQGTKYKLTITGDFYDSDNQKLNNEFISFFTVARGNDLDPPKILSAWAVNPDGSENKLSETGICDEWESRSALKIIFSKEVDTFNIKNCISVEPNVSFLIDTSERFIDSVLINFASVPVWNEVYTFNVLPGIRDVVGNESEDKAAFRIIANGRQSMPPQLAAIRLPMVPGVLNANEMDLRIYRLDDIFADFPIMPGEERYPYASQVKIWIELYFHTATDSEINVYSLMDHFRVEATNGAITFSPRNINDTNFSIAEPALEWAACKRIEITGYLTNTVNSGIVSFIISPGLEDTLGNINQKSMRISLLK